MSTSDGDDGIDGIERRRRDSSLDDDADADDDDNDGAVGCHDDGVEMLVNEFLSIARNDDEEDEGCEVAPPPLAEEHRERRTRQLRICNSLLEIVVLRRRREEEEAGADEDGGDVAGGTAGARVESPDDDDGASFIRTNMSGYKDGGRRDALEQRRPRPLLLLRDLLGNVSSSTASELAAALARSISHRVEIEALLPGTQDAQANMEAMGLSQPLSQKMMDDGDGNANKRNGGNGGNGGRRSTSSSSSAKAAMTISPLALASARLYAELLGTRGAWGAGMVDVGGVSALTALVRRWCAECRGRERALLPGEGRRKKNSGRRRPPAKKRPKPEKKERKVPLRKSVRISEIVSVVNEDDEDESDEEYDDGASAVNAPNDAKSNSTFQVVEEPDHDPSTRMQLTEYEMIAQGLHLARAIGRPPLLAEHRNWSPEAREFYLDGACAALGVGSALLSGCSSRCGDDDAGAAAVLCREAVSSLERALRSTVVVAPSTPDAAAARDGRSPPNGTIAIPSSRRSDGGGSRGRRRGGLSRIPPPSVAREEAAANERLRESAVYLLRGLLPLFDLKMELPNGQAGKLAAHGTASSLLAGIVGAISEDIELEYGGRISVESSSRRQRGDDEGGGGKAVARGRDSATPKRGGRKSISFSRTPAAAADNKGRRGDTKTPNTAMLAPPSLKKSVTPRRGGGRASLGSGGGGGRGPADADLQHPVLTPIVGMIQRAFTSRGLERADARSRACMLGMDCLERLPALERASLLRFAADMCESKVSSHRLLGVELIGEVLCRGWFWRDRERAAALAGTPFSARGHDGGDPGTDGGAGGESSADGRPDAPSSKLLAALRGRLDDKSPTVRTRAAMSLGEVAQRACDASNGGVNLDGTVIATVAPGGARGDGKRNDIPSRALAAALCEIGTSLVDALRHRAGSDERATVRRSSIVAWLQMLHLARREGRGEFAIGGLDISTLCQLCNDSSVATRKAAAEALTRLVQANNYEEGEEDGRREPQASSLEVAWAHTVLPLVSDAEATCVAKAAEFFSELVVEPIVELGKDAAGMLEDEDDGARYLVAWRILARLSDGAMEAGGSRNASGSLIVALQKLLIDARKDSKSLAKNLFRAIYHVGRTSLALGSTMSHDTGSEVDLFDINTAAMRTGAWCLLDALTSCLGNGNRGGAKSSSTANASLSNAVRASKIDSSFLTQSLQKLRELINSADVPADKKGDLAATSRNCLRVIAKMGSFVPVEDSRACFADLLSDLESFTILSIDLVSAALIALIALTKRMCDDFEAKGLFDEVKGWANRLLGRCETAIESCISSLARQGIMKECDEKLMPRVLYLIGEVCMIGFSSQEETPLSGSGQENIISPTDREPVRGLQVRPSARLLYLVKLMLPNSMPIPSATERETTPTPSTTRAHAFVALGKLCLRDETLAKESLNILARELHQDSDSDPAVVSNALMVMGDLCVRYTNLTDMYLPYMAACLQAGEGRPAEVNAVSRLSQSFGRKPHGYSMVKKNAILLLSSLLLRDYIKWRGLFVHRFLAAVADEDDEVSCLAQAALRGPLLEKFPNLLSNHFAGTVFVFNACKAHPLYAMESSSGGNGLAVDFECASLSGSDGCRRRRDVYKMMLANMTDEQKLEVTARLVKEILGGALETSGDLSAVCKLPAGERSLSNERVEAARNVLTDALAVLTSPEIRVGRRGANDAEEEDDLASANGPDRPMDRRNVHKRKLLTRISRKHLMEIVIPILCNLKTVLEASRSSLLKDLMRVLGFIFRSYRSEVREHLANDPTLLQELEYDMRQYEKKQKLSDRDSILQAEIVTEENAA